MLTASKLAPRPNTSASWPAFDADWYRRMYPEALASGTSDEDLLRYYVDHGQRLGHSPNPFFDERWYRRMNADVAEAVSRGDWHSGFDHYWHCAHEDRRPHCLFDAALYAGGARDEITTGSAAPVANRYDHFLRYGDRAGATASRFFDPAFYLATLAQPEAERAASTGALRHYLASRRPGSEEQRTSPYFDPVWYVARYPAAAAEIAGGLWQGALDHYLHNPTPLAFDPLPIFSETYYLAHNPDVARAVDACVLRSGYHHFLASGVGEGRLFHPDIDLTYYAETHPSVRADVASKRAPNRFTHLLTIGARHGWTAWPPDSARNTTSSSTERQDFSPGEAMSTRTPPRARVLYVEHMLPLRHLGCGLVRSNDIVSLMAELDLQVTVVPVERRYVEPSVIPANFPPNVEVIADRTQASVPALLEAHGGRYDILWIGRTYNLTVLHAAVANWRTTTRGRVVLDSEAIDAVRAQQRAALDNVAQPFDLDEAVEAEFAYARLCDAIVAVTPSEATILRRAGVRPVSVLGHLCDPQPTPRPFAEREGLLFVGAIHNQQSPNHDALCWFVERVLPLVVARLGDQARLTIAGYADADVDMSRWATHPHVTLLGPVADTRPLYDRHRVFVAPTRIAAGLPYKVHEAVSHGLPTVVSTLLADQLGWADDGELLAAPTSDPVAYADRIVRLYQSAEVWTRLRRTALARVTREHDRAAYRAALEAILFPPATAQQADVQSREIRTPSAGRRSGG